MRGAEPDDGGTRSAPPVTPDGRYIVARGHPWRAANPNRAPERRVTLVAKLNARRAVGVAKRSGADDVAHALVDAAKIVLGVSGAKWWPDAAPELNRHLVKNTPYAGRWQELTTQRSVAR